jgi:D-alanine-D-alanine ligase
LNVSTARVAVVFGGPSPEHDVSILTGLQAARELAGAQRDVIGLYWTKTGDWYRVDSSLEAADFVDGVPRGAQPLQLVTGGEGSGFVAGAGRLGRTRPLPLDAVVNCCHGGPGEDGTLQAALDLVGIAYSGPGVAGAALGMDKLAFAGVVAGAGLPALPRALLHGDGADVGFPGPYIVKPRFGGSSIGVEVVADLDTALARLGANAHLRAGAVVEPYRQDLFDLNVAARTWPQPALSAVERPLRSTAAAEILGYADKYVGGEGMASAPRQLPAELAPPVAAAVRDAAWRVLALAAVRGVARIDFLSDGESLFVNEVNTIPGSLARYLWVDPPLPFIELLDGLIGEALSRPAAHHSAAGADGTVLRSAGGIAGKLA